MIISRLAFMENKRNEKKWSEFFLTIYSMPIDQFSSRNRLLTEITWIGRFIREFIL